MSLLESRSASLPASHRAVTQTRAFLFASAALLYVITSLVATLTLNPYFSQTWDVRTFIQAAHRFLDGGNPFDLYAASRAAQTWPYAYPPLHALVTAIFLWVGNSVSILPDNVWARAPALIADIGVGLALYHIVSRRSSDESLGRAAFLLWLFNPVTFYDTVVQGHFESEWILFVVLAYFWFDRSPKIILPTLALAIAVLFKQVAILFAIPFWIMSLRGERRSNVQHGMETPARQHPRTGLRSSNTLTTEVATSVASVGVANGGAEGERGAHVASLQKTWLALTFISPALFVLVVFIICLPYLFYSNDFLYMNLTYVENVPVQTQSWVVALLALTRPAPDALTSEFFFLRYSTAITILAALVISFFAARRGWSLWLTAALIAIAFFLTSKKVMGYYYVMLFPFLFAEFLPRRRYGLVLAAIILSAWISLSPYFAPWANPDHIWIYAALGTLNSALWVWIFIRSLTPPSPSPWQGEGRASKQSVILEQDPRTPSLLRCARGGVAALLFISLGLFASAVLAAFLQAFAPDGGSPIRVPLIPPGTEPTVVGAFAALLALMAIGLLLLSRLTGHAPRAAWAIVLAFAPLFFVVYYLTKESTAVFEFLLKAIGV